MHRAIVAVALLVSVPALSKLPQTEDAFIGPESGAAGPAVEETLQRWPAPAQKVARAMIAEYGPPTRFDDASMVWLHNGPWEKTTVYRDGWPQTKVPEERDYLKQVIGYRVPLAKLEPIMRFDPRVEADSSTNELAARSPSEAISFLLLNLADDIVTEKRTPANARDFYDRTLRLAAAGKSSPYLTGFMFDPPNEKAVTP
jgi:hypothetical protein